MAKYLANSAGTITEVVGLATSAGAGDAGKIPQLDGTGRIDTSMMPTGIAADTQPVTASEALAAGDFVNIWSSAGAFRVRKADASTSGKDAHGFVLAAFANAAVATVYFEATNTQVASAAPGVVFLSATTPGGFTATAPSGVGQVVQRIGFATSATTINFQSNVPVVLA